MRIPLPALFRRKARPPAVAVESVRIRWQARATAGSGDLHDNGCRCYGCTSHRLVAHPSGRGASSIAPAPRAWAPPTKT